MGVASIYRSAGPEFEYRRDFYFREQWYKLIFPSKFNFFCHFQVEHMLEIHIFK